MQVGWEEILPFFHIIRLRFQAREKRVLLDGFQYLLYYSGTVVFRKVRGGVFVRVRWVNY